MCGLCKFVPLYGDVRLLRGPNNKGMVAVCTECRQARSASNPRELDSHDVHHVLVSPHHNLVIVLQGTPDEVRFYKDQLNPGLFVTYAHIAQCLFPRARVVWV